MLTIEIERHPFTQMLVARARFRAFWLGVAAGVLVAVVAAAVVR